jgi:hypothetical protein
MGQDEVRALQGGTPGLRRLCKALFSSFLTQDFGRFASSILGSAAPRLRRLPEVSLVSCLSPGPNRCEKNLQLHPEIQIHSLEMNNANFSIEVKKSFFK